MNLGQILHVFMADGKVQAVLALIALDLVLGVAAAWKVGNFRLSYVADFLRNDIALKVFPYFVLYAGALVAGQQDIVIPGLDLGVVAGAAYGILTLAMTGSILNSVRELGLAPPAQQKLAVAVAGSENDAPPKD